MIEIAPSILSADFSQLRQQIELVEGAGASLLHVDVMDGRFVPNITVGLPVVKAISRATRLPIDAHLMIVEPGRYAEQFVEAGAQMVSIHIEADPHAQSYPVGNPISRGPGGHRNQPSHLALGPG
jgi:ribulose-phosphate 3-epimerase